MSEETLDNGVVVKIIHDSDPLNPRTDYEEACTMVCDHGRYSLGDEDGHDKARDAIRASRDYRPSWEDYDSKGLDFSYGPDLWTAMQDCSDIVSLPLYLYDHSGITIRAGSPFSCPWDSGQVGFAFMTKAEILECYMSKGTRLTAALKAKAADLIKAETSCYDDYLTGNCWGYVVEFPDGEEDSCWGFLGDPDYCLEEAMSIAKSYEPEQPELELE
jgi:hypothetical protein